MQSSYALNIETRDDIIIRYLPLVKFIASRIAISKMTPVDNDDLVSYGIIGLIDAIDKFDASKEVKFETYASLRVRGAIIDELRKLSWMPRTAIAKISKLNEVRDELKNKLEREPTGQEIALDLGVPVQELSKIETYINYLSVVSLDEVIFKSDEDEVFLYSTVEDESSPRPENILLDKEKLTMLQKAIGMMSEKDRLVLNLYYYEKLTLKEIGQVIEVSESRVSQIHSRAILRLRDNLNKLNY